MLCTSNRACLGMKFLECEGRANSGTGQPVCLVACVSVGAQSAPKLYYRNLKCYYVPELAIHYI